MGVYKMCKVKLLDTLSDVEMTIKGVSAMIACLHVASISNQGEYKFMPEQYFLIEDILFGTLEKIAKIEKGLEKQAI
jgi:hypothetical protein